MPFRYYITIKHHERHSRERAYDFKLGKLQWANPQKLQDSDAVEIDRPKKMNDQNGETTIKKLSRRLDEKQKVDYKLLSGVQKHKGKKMS